MSYAAQLLDDPRVVRRDLPLAPKTLLAFLLDVKSRQSGGLLSGWKNNPALGVSVCLPVIQTLTGFGRRKCKTAIAYLKSRGLLFGGEIHWQLAPEIFKVIGKRGIIPIEIRLEVLAIGFCAHCSKPENLEVDHIIPISRGGTDDRRNLQPLCYSCNRRKGNRFIG